MESGKGKTNYVFFFFFRVIFVRMAYLKKVFSFVHIFIGKFLNCVLQFSIIIAIFMFYLVKMVIGKIVDICYVKKSIMPDEKRNDCNNYQCKYDCACKL